MFLRLESAHHTAVHAAMVDVGILGHIYYQIARRILLRRKGSEQGSSGLPPFSLVASTTFASKISAHHLPVVYGGARVDGTNASVSEYYGQPTFLNRSG